MDFIKEYLYINNKNKISSNKEIEWINKYNNKSDKCKKCYGRGYIAKDIDSGLYVPCKCVIKNYVKEYLKVNEG